MARLRITDRLQQYPFWLADIQPNLNPPFFAVNPLLGFSSISAPELTVENNAYRPLNSMYARHMPQGASVSPVTMRRGAVFTAEDFFRWTKRYIEGDDQSRRNLLLIHFMGLGTEGIGTLEIAPGINVGTPFSETVRVPGRVWILWDCVPSRYSGGDVDAKSGDVVMVELEVQPRMITETALGVII
jgi:phage tail-like protein